MTAKWSASQGEISMHPLKFKFKMASSASVLFGYTRLYIIDANTSKVCSLLLPNELQERASNNPNLSSAILAAMPVVPAAQETELDLDQSLQVLRGLGLLADSTPSRSAQVSSQDLQVTHQLEESGSERVIWSHAGVLLLVQLWRRRQHDFSNSCLSQKQAWRRLAQEMRAKGHLYSGHDCYRKFKSLRDRHKRIRDSHGRTGRGGRQWRYFDLMEELFQSDPSIFPVRSVASMPQTLQLFPEEVSSGLPPSSHPASPITPPATSSTTTAAATTTAAVTTTRTTERAAATTRTTATSRPSHRRRPALPSPQPVRFGEFHEEEAARWRARENFENRLLELEDQRVQLETRCVQILGEFRDEEAARQRARENFENRLLELKDKRVQLETTGVQILGGILDVLRRNANQNP